MELGQRDKIMSIVDNVRKAALEKSNTSAPQGNQTAAAATQIATSATGKGQSAAEGQALSNVGERLAMGQARAQQQALTKQQLQQASELQNQELAQQTEQQAIEQSLRIQNKQNKLQEADTIDQMLADIKYSEKQLADREDAVEVENLGIRMRLSNDEYLHNLNMIAEREKIDDRASFARKARELNRSSQLQNIVEKIDNNTELASMEIQSKLKEQLSQLDTALQYLEVDYQNVSASQNFTMGINTAASYISKGLDTSKDKKPEGDTN
jgi:hypothetical protein